ncbi:phage protein NinX family protein [Kluyvera genomosp. 1]|uniref:phage protein NinX family protein n=1 Tax=Kluyvera genomosp. 1 TaxID=2774053 RepID=UPI000690C33A|nr:phage protein NinX family protein [Kluyvera genomosp. 1]
MDYSKMSDFEINKRVFTALRGTKPLGYPHNADGRSVGNESNGNYTWYDYCNLPADSWAIIQENGISINHYNGVWEASFEWDAPVGAFGTDETVTTSTEHKNPLRAAMVAYLMMREVSDVQGNPA